MLSQIIGFTAGLIGYAGYGRYIFATLRGSAQPQLTSWFLWGIVGVLIAISYSEAGAQATIWFAISEAAGLLSVFLVSFWRGDPWHFVKADWQTLVGATISLSLWYVTGSPLIALLLLIVTDAMGSWLTIKQAFHEPEKEDKVAWLLLLLSSTVTTLLVIPWVGFESHVTFAQFIFPAYNIVITIPIAFFLWAHTKRRRGLTSSLKQTGRKIKAWVH
jgi:hypothetical protein